MNLRQLRYFVTIAEEGSFSRAAARLNVAQPALSIHVRRMEEQFGTELLLRGPKGVTPTEAGRHLHTRALAVLAELDRIDEEMTEFADQVSGVVRLGLPGTLSELLTVPLLTRMRARHPHVKLVVAEAMSGFVAEWLQTGRVDLGILYTDLLPPGIIAEPLADEELVVLAPTGTARARLNAADLLRNLQLILPSTAHGLRGVADGVIKALGLIPAPAIEVDSFRNIAALVATGHGCSILPMHAAVQAPSDAVIVARFPAPRPRRRISLAHSTERPPPHPARVVIAELSALTSELVADGTWCGAHVP